MKIQHSPQKISKRILGTRRRAQRKAKRKKKSCLKNSTLTPNRRAHKLKSQNKGSEVTSEELGSNQMKAQGNKRGT